MNLINKDNNTEHIDNLNSQIKYESEENKDNIKQIEINLYESVNQNKEENNIKSRNKNNNNKFEPQEVNNDIFQNRIIDSKEVSELNKKENQKNSEAKNKILRG